MNEGAKAEICLCVFIRAFAPLRETTRLLPAIQPVSERRVWRANN
jgi:hypothetical protein